MTASKFATRLKGYLDREPENEIRNMNVAEMEFGDHTVTVIDSGPDFNVIFEEMGKHVFSFNVGIDTYTGFTENPEAIGALGNLINEKIRPDQS